MDDARAELGAERARLLAQQQHLPKRPSDAEIDALHDLARQLAKEAGKASDLAQHEASVARRTAEDFESDGARRLLANMAEVSASFAKAYLMLESAAQAVQAQAGVLRGRQDACDTARMRIATRLYDIEQRLRR
jgi:hypothetical protein